VSVFENKLLRAIRAFGPKIGEITGEWRKLHHEPHNSHSPPDIIRMIESERMRYAVYVACRG
jgi:hypothetical protein